MPLNVRAILEECSPRYQKVNSYNNKITDKIRIEKKQEKTGTSEILLKNDKTKKLSKPVVIPSEIDANKKKKILSKPNQEPEEDVKEPVQKIIPEIENEEPEIDILKDIEIEELPEIKEIPQEEYMPEIDVEEMVEQEQELELESEEEIVQPVKRGRGRPRKNVEEQVEQQPKRKRGRPKKVAESEEELENEEEAILPGFEEDNEEDSEEEAILRGFEEENEEEATLPGFEEIDNEEEMLPGFEEDNEEEDKAEEMELPGFQEEPEEIILTEYNNTPKTKIENTEIELNIDEIMNSNQKLVAFVGTSKNGTSFLVNNVAEILSMNGIDTAILDLTRNRNSYYIYTKNDEQLRNQSNYVTANLKAGIANGIIEHKNLTIYTSPIEGDENLYAVEQIIEILAANHTVILMDCDFMTPMRYFKYAQEIYLVQSMDTLTIQPLTAFLRQLDDKGMFEPSKARVVLNKFIKTREINEDLLIGGMSIYNDSGMTVRKELFNRRTVERIVIPFDLKSYLRYLDGLVVCDVSLRGYSKEFMESLKQLANMIYQGAKKSGKYMPPSVKNNNSGFSPRINNTLNQMKQNY